MVKPERFLPSTHTALYLSPHASHNAFFTSENQSTGLERFELLGKLEGVDVFDMKPLQVDRLGTMKEPIKVYSLVSLSSRLDIQRAACKSLVNQHVGGY